MTMDVKYLPFIPYKLPENYTFEAEKTQVCPEKPPFEPKDIPLVELYFMALGLDIYADNAVETSYTRGGPNSLGAAGDLAPKITAFFSDYQYDQLYASLRASFTQGFGRYFETKIGAHDAANTAKKIDQIKTIQAMLISPPSELTAGDKTKLELYFMALGLDIQADGSVDVSYNLNAPNSLGAAGDLAPKVTAFFSAYEYDKLYASIRALFSPRFARYFEAKVGAHDAANTVKKIDQIKIIQAMLMSNNAGFCPSGTVASSTADLYRHDVLDNINYLKLGDPKEDPSNPGAIQLCQEVATDPVCAAVWHETDPLKSLPSYFTRRLVGELAKEFPELKDFDTFPKLTPDDVASKVLPNDDSADDLFKALNTIKESGQIKRPADKSVLMAGLGLLDAKKYADNAQQMQDKKPVTSAELKDLLTAPPIPSDQLAAEGLNIPRSNKDLRGKINPVDPFCNAPAGTGEAQANSGAGTGYSALDSGLPDPPPPPPPPPPPLIAAPTKEELKRARFDDVVDFLQPELSVYAGGGWRDNAALESQTAGNIGGHLGLAPGISTDAVEWRTPLSLDYKHVFYDVFYDGQPDTYRLRTGVGQYIKINTPYVQPFASIDWQATTQQYNRPSLLAPTAQEGTLLPRLGITFDLWGGTGEVAGSYRRTWFQRTFHNETLNDQLYTYSGDEQTGGFSVSYRRPGKKVDLFLSGSGDFGTTQVPRVTAVDGVKTSEGIKTVGLRQGQFTASLTVKKIWTTFSVAGSFLHYDGGYSDINYLTPGVTVQPPWHNGAYGVKVNVPISLTDDHHGGEVIIFFDPTRLIDYLVNK